MYLGFNCNQHTFSASVLDPESGELVYYDAVHFDEDLPHRETTDGVIEGDQPGEYGIDPQMLVEALEHLLEKLQDSSLVDLSEISHITGTASAATLFINDSFESVINDVNPNLPLVDQIRPIYTTRLSPSSADSSAAQFAEQLKEDYHDLTGRDTRSITGSPLNSASGAAQINKFSRQTEQEWSEARYIHTTSSFLLSLLIGKNAPLDLTDTSQLCLFNIHTKSWQEDLISICAPEALEKLPEIADPGVFVNHVSEYFCSKYGFSADAKCLSWLSQDAAHAMGLNLLNPGSSNIELNENYTFSLVTKSIPSTIPTLARVTLHPIAGYISHMVLENGLSGFRTTLENLEIDFEDIEAHLQSIPSSTQHLPVLPFVENEKALLIPAAKQREVSLLSYARGQILHIKLYSQWIDHAPSRIYVSGKGAVVKGVQLICANIFQVDCIHIDDEIANTKGLAIHCDIEQDVSRKTIFHKYHRPLIVDKTTPEPYMANIYSNQLNHYHQLLYNHINKKATTF